MKDTTDCLHILYLYLNRPLSSTGRQAANVPKNSTENVWCSYNTDIFYTMLEKLLVSGEMKWKWLLQPSQFLLDGGGKADLVGT